MAATLAGAYMARSPGARRKPLHMADQGPGGIVLLKGCSDLVRLPTPRRFRSSQAEREPGKTAATTNIMLAGSTIRVPTIVKTKRFHGTFSNESNKTPRPCLSRTASRAKSRPSSYSTCYAIRSSLIDQFHSTTMQLCSYIIAILMDTYHMYPMR